MISHVSALEKDQDKHRQLPQSGDTSSVLLCDGV